MASRAVDRKWLSDAELRARFDEAGGMTFRVRTAAGDTRSFWLIQTRQPDQHETFAGGATTVACAGLERGEPFASFWLGITAHQRFRGVLRARARTSPVFDATIANLLPFLSHVDAKGSPALRHAWYRIVDLWGTGGEGIKAAQLADQLEDRCKQPRLSPPPSSIHPHTSGPS